MKVQPLILSLLIFSFSATSSAETVYVSSLQAKLLANPQFKAKQISLLSKGQALNVVDEKGSWLQVSTPENQQGWLSKFLTKATPPNERITVLPGDKETQLKDVRRRTSTITTAAAARGLAALEETNAKEIYQSDRKAVEYMESFQINPRDLKAFSLRIFEGAQ